MEAPAVEVLGQKASWPGLSAPGLPPFRGLGFRGTPSLFGAFGLGQHHVSDEPGHDDGQLVGEEEEEEAAEVEETFEASRGQRGIPQEPVGSPEEPGELLVALLWKAQIMSQPDLPPPTTSTFKSFLMISSMTSSWRTGALST